jgi:hypothetical protein
MAEKKSRLPPNGITCEIVTPEGPIATTKRRRATTRGVDYKKLVSIRTNVTRSPTKGSPTKAKAKARGENVSEISE